MDTSSVSKTGNNYGRTGGIGFIINENTSKVVKKYERIWERLALRYQGVRIIGLYCPTSVSDYNEIEEVYKDLYTFVNREKSIYVVKMGGLMTT